MRVSEYSEIFNYINTNEHMHTTGMMFCATFCAAARSRSYSLQSSLSLSKSTNDDRAEWRSYLCSSTHMRTNANVLAIGNFGVRCDVCVRTCMSVRTISSSVCVCRRAERALVCAHNASQINLIVVRVCPYICVCGCACVCVFVSAVTDRRLQSESI